MNFDIMGVRITLTAPIPAGLVQGTEAVRFRMVPPGGLVALFGTKPVGQSPSPTEIGRSGFGVGAAWDFLTVRGLTRRSTGARGAMPLIRSACRAPRPVSLVVRSSGWNTINGDNMKAEHNPNAVTPFASAVDRWCFQSRWSPERRGQWAAEGPQFTNAQKSCSRPTSRAGLRPAGFFTLSAGSVNCSDLPESLARKLPRYPIPVALIGRLAVDQPYQGKGLGSILLADACEKVRQARKTLAVAGIIVDAKSASATGFYRHFGFAELPGKPHRLLLPTAAFC